MRARDEIGDFGQLNLEVLLVTSLSIAAFGSDYVLGGEE